MKFLDALRPGPQVQRNDMSFQDWINAFQSNVLSYPGQWPGYQFTYGKDPAEPIANSFAGYVAGGLQSNGIIFALELKRLQVFSQARFQYQRMRNGRPGDLFGDRSLTILERPWPGGTTGDMLARMILDADFAGNSWKVPLDGEIVRLRPDYVEIVLKPRMMPLGPDGEDVQVGFKQIGILYYEGGIYSGAKPAVFLPGEYSHFAPIPDPLAAYRGMSWLTPVIRELQADTSATKHKLKFFENAASPNLAVSLPKEITPDQFSAFVEKMNARHKGVEHAYETLYTGGGADVTVIGQNMQQMDFKVTQGAGETRLAAAAGIHPVVAGLSEGMQGSSLNAGNYTAAKRNTVDTTFRHLWQNAAGSLEPLVSPPEDTRLWYDARDIPFLHEDQKDVASIQQAQASAWRQLVDGGMAPDSATAFIQTNDLSVLMGQHSGLYSVQLQPPTDGQDPTSSPATDDEPFRSAMPDVDGWDEWDDDPIGDLDEDTEALIYALQRYAPKAARALQGAAFNAKHKRGPGGRFITMVDRVINALNDHKKNGGKGDPFKSFDREQLRKAAKARGIPLKRGEDRDSIVQKLLADLGGPPAKKVPEEKAVPVKAVGIAKVPAPKVPKPKAPARKAAAPKAEFQLDDADRLRVKVLAFAGGPWFSKKESLQVRVNKGLGHIQIGAIHREQDDTWTASPMGDFKAFFVAPKKANRDQAIKALLDAYDAGNRPDDAKDLVAQDRLEELKYPDLVGLALQHGVKVMGRPNKDIIADIRREIAVKAKRPAAGKVDESDLANAHMADLVKLANQHGIGLAGKNRGELVKELQRRMKPHGPAKYHRNLAGIEDLHNTIENGAVVDERRLAGGAIGDTRLRKYADGTRVVWKRSGEVGENDSEQLSSKVARALGLHAPRIYRNRDHEVNMDFIDGDVAFDAFAGAPDEILNSNDGRMMGLLDQLIANTDRHDGNWMVIRPGVGKRERPVPIDHGYAFGNRPGQKLRDGGKPAWVRSEFAAHYSNQDLGNRWLDNDLTKKDIVELRRRIEALRPDFEHLGRGNWHKFMTDRLDAIGQHAKGTKSRLLPPVV